jgi:mono/diheme cytochrome c family protein
MRLSLWPACGVALILGASEASAGDVAAGEERYLVNCVNCHGREGKGMASFPAIQGRDAEYIADRLTTYRAREMVGPNSAIMMSLTGDLSDEDIANLAAYISTTFE